MDTFWEYTVIRFKGKRYLITKVNPKNYKIVDEDGKTYNLRRNAVGITKDGNQMWDTPTAPSAPATKVDVPELMLGDTVTFKRAGDAAKFPGTYVVAKKNPTTYVLVRLNGGSDSSVKASFGLVKKVEITVNVPAN